MSLISFPLRLSHNSVECWKGQPLIIMHEAWKTSIWIYLTCFFTRRWSSPAQLPAKAKGFRRKSFWLFTVCLLSRRISSGRWMSFYLSAQLFAMSTQIWHFFFSPWWDWFTFPTLCLKQISHQLLISNLRPSIVFIEAAQSGDSWICLCKSWWNFGEGRKRICDDVPHVFVQSYESVGYCSMNLSWPGHMIQCEVSWLSHPPSVRTQYASSERDQVRSEVGSYSNLLQVPEQKHIYRCWDWKWFLS